MLITCNKEGCDIIFLLLLLPSHVCQLPKLHWEYTALMYPQGVLITYDKDECDIIFLLLVPSHVRRMPKLHLEYAALKYCCSG